MEQLEKLQPLAVNVSNHRVIVSDKVFSEIINTINKEIEVINILIDKNNEDHESIKELRGQIKNLANALNTII